MMRTRYFALGLALLLGLASSIAVGQGKASFDCSKAASSIEKLVCGDAKLAAADTSMAKLYALAQTSAFGRGTSNQLAAQREWLGSRNACMTMGAGKAADGGDYGPADCVADSYRERNRELAVAVLLDHPDVALGVLREGHPEIAPLYEALQLYLTKPASTQWSDPAHRDTREKVLALLQPYFTDLQQDDQKGYGYSVLSDIAASPADAISSDAKFASTFGIIGVYLPNDGAASVPFPCAAIVRRPDMVSAISPYFGSTLDNFLPWADCPQSLPAQLRLEALAKALNAFWKDDCGGGSIRFAYYRSYNQLVTSARIGLPVDAAKGVLARKGLRPQLVTAATAELADQYQRYNGLSPAEANTRARHWLGRMIANAGECES